MIVMIVQVSLPLSSFLARSHELHRYRVNDVGAYNPWFNPYGAKYVDVYVIPSAE